MAETPILATLYIKVWALDGTLVVDGLPHIHNSTWNVLTLQKGGNSSQALGPFTITLYPPRSVEYQAYKALYDLLAPAMRIEAYKQVDGMFLNSTVPDFTGIIHKLPKSFDSYEIQGFDWLWFLDHQLSIVGEGTQGQTGGAIINNYLSATEIIIADDFAGNGIRNSAPNVFPAGTWTGPIANEGLQTWTSSNLAAQSNLLMNPNTIGNYDPVIEFETWFHFKPPATFAATNVLGECGLLLGMDGLGASAQNGWLLQGNIIADNASTYTINAEVWQISAGVYTQRITKVAFSGLSGEHRFQITAIGDNRFAPTFFWRVMINGKDTACVWNFTGLPSGFVGLRWGPGSTGGQIWATQMIFKQRRVNTKFFMKGNIDTALGVSFPGTLDALSANGKSFLQVVADACNFAGGTIRKRPIAWNTAGTAGDFVDFGAFPTAGAADTNVGRDRSQYITLEEGISLSDLQLEANLESVASTLRFSGNVGGDNNGIINWPSIANIKSIGVAPGNNTATFAIDDGDVSVGTSDFLTLRRLAENVIGLKATPNVAKIVKMIRHPSVADKFRELDIITINSPLMEIFRAKALVIGYTFTENSAEQEILIDQYPWLNQFQQEREWQGANDVLWQTFGSR